MEDFLVRIVSFPTVVFTVFVAVSLVYWGFVIVSGLGFDGAEGVGESLGEADGVEALGDAAALLGWIGFGRAPLSLLLSAWSLAAWVASYLLSLLLLPADLAGWPLFGLCVLVGVLALIVGTPFVHFVAGRLGPLLEGEPAEVRADLVGRTCIVTTGTVEEGFGQARLEEDGDWRVVQVRATPGILSRGDTALIVGWDAELEAFRVEAMASPRSE